VVFQAADNAAIPEGLTLLRDGGRYISIGVGGNASISADLFPGQMTFMNVRSGEPRHWLQAIDFLASRKDRVPFDALISETYTLEQVNEAITALAAYEIVKPVITFG
jgi:threonine dehydrogenase-like Zn-dependent dehydrogenase